MRERSRQFLLDAADCVERLQGTVAQVRLAGRDWENQRVEEEVARWDAVFLRADVVDALGDAELPVGGGRLAFLVDGQGDERRAIAFGQRYDCLDFLAALFQIDRVDDR